MPKRKCKYGRNRSTGLCRTTNYSPSKETRARKTARGGRWNAICSGKGRRWQHKQRCRNKGNGQWTLRQYCKSC